MLTVEDIKSKVRALYNTSPDIHVSISMTRPRLTVKEAPAKIVGVYPNIFVLEENSLGYVRRHSLQYADVLIGQVTICELGKA